MVQVWHDEGQRRPHRRTAEAFEELRRKKPRRTLARYNAGGLDSVRLQRNELA